MKSKHVFWLSISGLVLGVSLLIGLGLYRLSQLGWSDPISQITSGGFGHNHNYAAGPTVPVSLPAGTTNAEDFDAMPAFEVMNGTSSTSLPRSFSAGSVTPISNKNQKVYQSGNEMRVKLGTTQVPTPAYANGKVFTSMGFTGTEFCAIDAKTGETLWAVTLSDDGPSTPAVSGDCVLINTESCTLFCLDQETGKQLWSKYLGDPTISTPTVYDGAVYTAYPAGGGAQAQVKGTAIDGEAATTINKTIGASHALICMNAKTGSIIWQQRIDGDLMTSPSVVGDTLYAATFSGTLYAFDRKTGTPIAVRHNQVTSLPTPVGDKLYFTRRQGSGEDVREQVVQADPNTLEVVRVLHDQPSPYLDASVQSQAAYAQDGELMDAENGFAGGAPETAKGDLAMDNIGLGNVSTMQAYQGSRLIAAGGVLFTTMGDTLMRIEPDADEPIAWAQAMEGKVEIEGGALASPPAYVNGKLFYGTVTGKLIMADAKTGQTLEWWAVGDAMRSQPIIADGKIIAGSADGQVHLIDTGDKTLDGWHLWGGDDRNSGTTE